MTEKRIGGADSMPLTEQEELEAYAAEQMWGRGRWEFIEENAEGTPVFFSGPVPPESVWEGKKTEALAAARVHRLIAADVGRVIEELDGAYDETAEAMESKHTSEEMRRTLYAIKSGISDATYGLRGILLDGSDGDDMDISMTSLFHAIFEEMVRLRQGREGEETASGATEQETAG